MDYYAAIERLLTDWQVRCERPHCMIPFTRYTGEGKPVSTEDTGVTAVAWSWMVITKRQRHFLRFGVILILNFCGGRTVVYICQNSLYTEDVKLSLKTQS